MSANESAIHEAEDVFRRRGGVLRTREALAAGIHPRTLYAMRDDGLIEPLARGLYRLADLPPLGDPDLATVALKAPEGVVCLISALSFHDLTTQVPHQVDLALRRGRRPPRIDHPPIRPFWFGERAFTEGVERYELDDITVRIYSPEKTLADCFKHRNKLGLDVAVEALRFYRERRRLDVEALLHFAEVCRVEKVMRPYLEATL